MKLLKNLKLWKIYPKRIFGRKIASNLIKFYREELDDRYGDHEREKDCDELPEVRRQDDLRKILRYKQRVLWMALRDLRGYP